MAKFVPKAKGLVSLNLGVSSSPFRIFAAMFWQVVNSYSDASQTIVQNPQRFRRQR